MENINLTGQFLIAMPSMTDPYFSKTITFICTHNQDGAMGLVINRPIELNVGSLFKQMNLEIEVSPLLTQPLHFGGPVQQERGFILHLPQEEYNSTIVVNNTVALTTSKDILEATANHRGPDKMLIALGYAGWTTGQLEDEMARNAWLSLETAQTKDLYALIFDTPSPAKFDLAMGMMGLNLANLSDVAGHA
ncbi:MAG: YqgE/AlgH family protein [Methylophilaceae bacterium]